MTLARAEREAICDLFDALGPDAPTLCAGWNAYDLLTHLVLRERRPDATLGVLLPALAGHTASVERSLRAKHGFAGLVRLVRSGPGGIFGLIPGLDSAANSVEYFVHHEDLRRAQPGWEPRTLPTAVQDALWRRLSGVGRLMLRRAPAGMLLRDESGRAALAGPKDGPRVEVTGPPAELLMFCFGRQAHARVELSGDETAVAALRNARFGV
ncbi:TIGR03085 family protein [Microtetraspora sp. NBRC 13810]|uniref:TIGR03085 family metal-binding protein n=1 Tax=Microtetraspora sp. NBRC 13810 TaxID=3030990 RepID=UPI0024A5026D|nr:TIGR03085 family metal-binding protein [Microtetraspora sp. NBRC 13810]GLW12223.1 TIGR03085 family protein [Microtetraspora sp. NBRC 13810]